MSATDPTMKKNKTKTEPAETIDSEDVILRRLPYHIIVDIFCKVPTKKLLQFKTVCKSWHSLLSDPQFARELFSRTPSCFMMYSEVHAGGLFIVDPEKASSLDGVSLRVPQPANADHRLSSCNIVGICNGLLCICDTQWPNSWGFYLLQPITGETLALPRLENLKKGEELHAYGFGFSAITGVYKLLVILQQPDIKCDELKAMVLTVGSKSWRNIGSSYKLDRGWRMMQDMIYLNGSLHWYHYKSCSYTIYAFDIESERSQELQMDCALTRCFRSLYFTRSHYVNRLGVLGGYLSLTDQVLSAAIHDVWVRKQYGVKESWTKELAIQNIRYPLEPLKFTDGKLILTSYAGPRGFCFLMAYSLRTSEIERIEVVGMPSDTSCIKLFVPSLVSLKDILWSLQGY